MPAAARLKAMHMQNSHEIGPAVGAPFGADLPFGDLLHMAFVELREARDRITVSRQLLGIERPSPRLSHSGPAIASDDLVLL